MADALMVIGTEKALFVTGREGLDELSITMESDIIEVEGNKKRSYTISPEDVGLKRGNLRDIQVDSPAESAKLIISILKGRANESATGIVALNAGAALYVYNHVDSIKAGVEYVQSALKSGELFEHYHSLKKGAMIDA